MNFRTLDDLDPAQKRCLVRVDLNVPMKEGAVTDFTRIDRILPTLKHLSASGAKTILLAHFGRPKGRVKPQESLAPIADALKARSGLNVAFAPDCIGEKAKNAVEAAAWGDVILLENTRYHAGEEANDEGFAELLAANGDLYINDAFSAAHRAHASTHALANILPAYAGLAMQAELEALNAALGDPVRPVTAVVGGAKVSTKLDLLANLVVKVDCLVIGGGMANTFLAAQGTDVGKSLCEHDLVATARDIIARASENDCEILLPADVVVAKEFAANAVNETVDAKKVKADQMILDVGPASVSEIEKRFAASKTVVWNGPLGAFEMTPFDRATVAAAKAAGNQSRSGNLCSVAGGGDTVAALNHAGVADDFTYVSTAGGAFLEWMEGKVLPGVAALDVK